MSARVALALALIACQGGGDRAPAAGSGSGSASTSTAGAPPPLASDAAPAVDVDADPGTGSAAAGSDEPDPTLDKPTALADLGAIAAWQAVVDRAHYLGRRGERGVVYGTLGPAADATTTWLVDDTEGNGTLGIRVALGALAAKATAGDRVAIGGAWELDAERRYQWKAARLDKLALPPPKSDLSEARPAMPSHVVANGELPAGARTVGLAKDNDAIYFTVVGAPPQSEGDGWAIADELGNPTVALLFLPGEHASYGGLDLRTPDERWALRRGFQYWVRAGKIRKRDGKPALINARTAPVRVK